MLSNGFQKGRYILDHPFGKMYEIYKDEYHIHFEKCLIEGQISQELFSQLHALKHFSQIVEYESQNENIIVENIRPLPQNMSVQDIKKMIIDMFYAVQILKDHEISIESIKINQIYQSKNHYKLDCYCIGHSDYQELIQDICNIGLNIIDSKEKELYNILMQYVNIKYQVSFQKMINKIEMSHINNTQYEINYKESIDYRKNQWITLQLPYYVLTNYLIIIIIAILFIIFLVL